MNEYFAEFDGINGCYDCHYTTNNYRELIAWVEESLEELGGGHADIFDEDGDFVEDVEV